MKLKTKIRDQNFSSDSITNGRLVKKFFVELSKNIFSHSYLHWKKYKKITGNSELPLTYSERNLYSIVASSINDITPIHLSEWGFDKNSEEKLSKNRRVDFWCLNKDSENGKSINYFIELKKGWYCLNKNSNQDLQKSIQDEFVKLQDQLKTLRNIKLGWEGLNDVFLGIMIIHSYGKEGKTSYSEIDIEKNLKKLIDYRSNFQLIISNWFIPADMNDEGEENKYSFISIVGLCLEKKST